MPTSAEYKPSVLIPTASLSHKSGQLELYDHTSSAGETKNLAEGQPEKAAALLKQLRVRLPQ